MLLGVAVPASVAPMSDPARFDRRTVLVAGAVTLLGPHCVMAGRPDLETLLRAGLAGMGKPEPGAKLDLVRLRREGRSAAALVRLTWSPGLRQTAFRAGIATDPAAMAADLLGDVEEWLAAAL